MSDFTGQRDLEKEVQGKLRHQLYSQYFNILSHKYLSYRRSVFLVTSIIDRSLLQAVNKPLLQACVLSALSRHYRKVLNVIFDLCFI